jgi:hypothetical protein
MSVKKMIGGFSPEEESPFDADIIMQINGVFGILQQLGVGPKEGFCIEDASTQWTEFSTDTIVLNMVKPYMYAKVRLGFDLSTTSSAVIEALNRQVAEFEWRMNVHVDPGEEKT